MALFALGQISIYKAIGEERLRIRKYGNDVLGLDLVGLQLVLVQRLADNLHHAPEPVARGLVFQAGLIRLPPFLGELAEQPRSLAAALLIGTVLSWIISLGKVARLRPACSWPRRA